MSDRKKELRLVMIDYEETKRFYETMDAWDTDLYGTYTPAYISRFITKTLRTLPIDEKTKILNAGSGGRVYFNKGEQYHIDLAASKLKGVQNAIVGNVIDMPYRDEFFDIVLMSGCVMSYCEADKAIRELSRVLKLGGYLVVDYERSGSAVLPFFLRNRDVFQAKYQYIGKSHRSYLYSDKYIQRLLDDNNLHVLQSMRFNALYALVDPLPQFLIRKFYSMDLEISNKGFWRRFAHNEILIAEKRGYNRFGRSARL